MFVKQMMPLSLYAASGWYTTKIDDINWVLRGSFQEGDIQIWQYLRGDFSKHWSPRTIVVANSGLFLHLLYFHVFRIYFKLLLWTNTLSNDSSMQCCWNIDKTLLDLWYFSVFMFLKIKSTRKMIICFGILIFENNF